MEERARHAKELEGQVRQALLDRGFPPESIRPEFKARERLFDFGIVDPETGTLLALVESLVTNGDREVAHPIVLQNLSLVAETLAVPLFVVVRELEGKTLELLSLKERDMPHRWPRVPFQDRFPRFHDLRAAKLTVLETASKKGRERTYRKLVVVSFTTAGVACVLLAGDILYREWVGHRLFENYHWLVVAGVYVALAVPFYRRISFGSITVEQMLAEDEESD